MSQPIVGGAGFRPACPTPSPQTDTQMGWELVFWDARAPDSALGILAECVLGNVRPTGNRGLPLTPSRGWAGSGERSECMRERGERGWGAVCKGLSVKVYEGGQLASKACVFICAREEDGCQHVGV